MSERTKKYVLLMAAQMLRDDADELARCFKTADGAWDHNVECIAEIVEVHNRRVLVAGELESFSEAA